MKVEVKEILDQFDRLPEVEKVEVTAAILQRFRAVFNPPQSLVGQDWKQLVFGLAGSWGDEFPSLDQIRDSIGQDLPREIF